MKRGILKLKNTIVNSKNKFVYWIYTSMAAVTTMMTGAIAVSATEGTSTTTPGADFIPSILKKVFEVISGNITLLAVVSAAIAIVMIIFGSSGKSAESSMRGLKIIVFCWIGFSVLGAIVKWGDAVLAPYGFTA